MLCIRNNVSNMFKEVGICSHIDLIVHQMVREYILQLNTSLDVVETLGIDFNTDSITSLSSRLKADI